MTDKEKIRKALAPLRASDTVVQEVLEMAERKNTHTIKKSTRTLLIAAAAAVLLIGTALAVTYSSWSPGLLDRLNLTEDEAAALEETELISRPLASDTHDGITVSVEQSVADGNVAFIALRVEGLEVPEGQSPMLGEPQLTLDGEPAANWGISAYNDLTWDGQKFVYSDGTEAKQTEKGVPIPRYMRDDGSVEIDIDINPGEGETGSLVGRTVSLRIDRLGMAPVTAGYVPEEERTYTAEGPWILTWTLEGDEISRTWTLNEPLGDTGAAVTEVTLSALFVHIDYDYPLQMIDEIAFDQDGNMVTVQVVQEPPILHGIVMKDGTEYSNVLRGGTFGYVDDETVYRIDFPLNRIIDPDEVAALVFCEVGYGDVPEGELVTYTVTLPD